MNWLKNLDPRALLKKDKQDPATSTQDSAPSTGTTGTDATTPAQENTTSTSTTVTTHANDTIAGEAGNTPTTLGMADATMAPPPAPTLSSTGEAAPSASPASYLLARYETAVKGLQDNATYNTQSSKHWHKQSTVAVQHSKIIHEDWQQLESELRLLPSVGVALEEVASKLEYALATFEQLDERVNQLHLQKHEKNLQAWMERENASLQQASEKDQQSILHLRQQLGRRAQQRDRDIALQKARAEQARLDEQRRLERDSVARELAKEQAANAEFSEQFRRELAHVQEHVGQRDLPDMSIDQDPSDAAETEAFLNATTDSIDTTKEVESQPDAGTTVGTSEAAGDQAVGCGTKESEAADSSAVEGDGKDEEEKEDEKAEEKASDTAQEGGDKDTNEDKEEGQLACSKCNTAHAADDVFCRKCGNRVSGDDS